MKIFILSLIALCGISCAMIYTLEDGKLIGAECCGCFLGHTTIN